MTLSAMRRCAPRAFVVATFSLLLTACGGGGGGSDPAPAATTYTVGTSAGTGGSISPASATVDDGETASFTVTADSGYSIDSVTGCGGSLVGATYTTGAVTADCTVTAGFAADPVAPVTHTVSTTSGTGGSITPASATVDDGATASFTVTADSGYAIDSVTGCGGTLGGNTYTTGGVTADCTVSATFAALPTVSIADASMVEGNSGTASLTFTVSLSEQANGDVTVDYATSDGTATAGSDYTATSGTLTIPAASTSGQITATINGDTIAEGSETLTLTLSNVSANAALGTATATGTLLNDDATGTLNDTGITLCGDYDPTHSQNNLDCAAVGATATADGTDGDGDPVPAGQDAHFGRDVTANDDTDGHSGFSFTKIDASGNPLPADANNWDCVLDNVTGLMWEVKTSEGGLRNANHTYTWYNSDPASNGGSAGTANGGSCFDSTNCDTEKYVAQVNAPANGGICGYSDWRMPTRKELMSLVDSSITYPGPTIDTAYFPNTPAHSDSWFWPSSPDAEGSTYGSNDAWYVSFYNSYVGTYGKGYIGRVRLVRAGQ